MSYSESELIQACVATLSLPIFFVAPGYLVARATDLLGFRRLVWPERLLWAVVLSVPLALLVSVHPWLPLGQPAVLGIFVAVAIAAALFAWRDARSRTSPRFYWDTPAMIFVAAIALLALYCLLSLLPFEFHGRLYECSAQGDWSVRVQLVRACIRGGVHPVNPMYDIAGQTVPLRVYFYWYVLCAQIHLLTGADARCSLIASCVAAAVALPSVLLLCLKYLRISRQPLRRQALALMVAFFILGLQFLIAIRDYVAWHSMRAVPGILIVDGTPDLLGLVRWSPHHAGGFVCCLAGLLLVITALDLTWKRCVLHAILAGLFFAAAVGTSTLIVAMFVFVFVALALDATLRRQWKPLTTLAAATLIALALSLPFLSMILHTQAGTGFTHGAKFPFAVFPRYVRESAGFVLFHAYGPRALAGPAAFTKRLEAFRLLVIVGLLVVDLGFLLSVVADRVRRDLLQPARLSRNRRTLWIIFLAAAVPGFLITSAAADGVNDVAIHAGLIMRSICILWCAPLFLEVRDRLREHQPISPWPRFWRVAAVVFFTAGLVSEVATAAIDRFQIPLVDAGVVSAYYAPHRIPNLARRYGQMQAAMQAAVRLTPANGIVQGYPHGNFELTLMLYNERQMAAADDGCELPFGGNPALCQQAVMQLNELFGGVREVPKYRRAFPAMPFDPAKVTPANFAAVCANLKLSTVVVDYRDPAWQHPNTWVWQLTPAFANPTARVFLCAAGNASASDASSETAEAQAAAEVAPASFPRR